MESWINLSKKRYFTADDMRGISNNFKYLKEYFESLNIVMEDLKDLTVDISLSPTLILEKFNDVEHNIQIIEAAANRYLGFFNSNFKKFYWEGYEKDFKPEIYRWIDWLEEIKSFNVQFVDLLDINNEIITDKNNETLQVLENIKGEI